MKSNIFCSKTIVSLIQIHKTGSPLIISTAWNEKYSTEENSKQGATYIPLDRWRTQLPGARVADQ